MATILGSCKPLRPPPLCQRSSKPLSRGSSLLALRGSSKEDASLSSPATSPSSFDVSVFRFTLGIPGFDDSNLPRVLGTAFGAVLLLNHFFTADSVTAAQWRSELIGMCDAIFSISLPFVGKSLIGGTSINAATSMSRSKQVFFLSKTLSLDEKEDLAWGSYALLKNTKTTSLVIWKKGLVCARGLWEGPERGQGDVSEWLEEAVKMSSLFSYNKLFYEPFKADKLGGELIPSGVVCSLLLPFRGDVVEGSDMDLMVNRAFLLLLSNIPNAFNQKDILWAEKLSNKLLTSKSKA